MPAPNGVMFCNTLNPNIHGSDNTIMTIALMSEDFLTDTFVRSELKPIIFWKIAITVERAAKDMNKKNNAPHICPKNMWLNIFGNVTNISFGPCDGSTPVSYTHLSQEVTSLEIHAVSIPLLRSQDNYFGIFSIKTL